MSEHIDRMVDEFYTAFPEDADARLVRETLKLLLTNIERAMVIERIPVGVRHRVLRTAIFGAPEPDPTQQIGVELRAAQAQLTGEWPTWLYLIGSDLVEKRPEKPA